MKQRLQILMDKESLSPVRFAEIVGVQRSSVSHILSGRNNPSLDFIQKILLAFPEVSSDWLISGKGSVYRALPAASEEQQGKKPDTLPSAARPEQNDLFSASKSMESTVPEPSHASPSPLGEALKVVGETEIEQIVVFYKDKSFRSYHPKG